ncbi:hypothetical protein NM688_g4790 [Phlebia brevispora]|uniref:Uncharacterized protein n=1 Tax=Phlebia brevispora TaxID=194682 RepID=A0ACC1T1W3_9APHY|nr:hypothetical protein NM688_g4790 [Phlebia brevispora]
MSVFKGGLPEDIPLKWNNRLTSTAGRAQCRSANGSKTYQIELATKILDSDARIRYTLSHEMCHLACWVIDGAMNEQHGALFKKWAKKVMKVRSDITISTRHSYEISYPYEWVCVKCSKVYGRFSKSIQVEKVVCTRCHGDLQPTFEVRAPKTPKGASPTKLAASILQASPIPAVGMSDSIRDSTPASRNALGSTVLNTTAVDALNQSFDLLAIQTS